MDEDDFWMLEYRLVIGFVIGICSSLIGGVLYYCCCRQSTLNVLNQRQKSKRDDRLNAFYTNDTNCRGNSMDRVSIPIDIGHSVPEFRIPGIPDDRDLPITPPEYSACKVTSDDLPPPYSYVPPPSFVDAVQVFCQKSEKLNFFFFNLKFFYRKRESNVD